jgi:hypothetical protein
MHTVRFDVSVSVNKGTPYETLSKAKGAEQHHQAGGT